MRDDKWLFEKLDEVWDNHFSDVPQDNAVKIVWGRRARSLLGSIKLIPSTSSVKDKDRKPFRNSKLETQNSYPHRSTQITINSLFKDETIPEFVVLGTIAHELAHYAHGFNSPLEQKFATPHAGGIIHRELDQRGLGQLYRKQKKWLKENWREFVALNMKPPTPRKRRMVIIKWI